MKFFKNIAAIATLCTIGPVYTKQVGSKSVQPIPQPIRPVIQPTPISTTTPTRTQPSKQIPKELPKLYPSQTQQSLLKKINDLESIAIETYKIIEERLMSMPLEEQTILMDATDNMFNNFAEQTEKVFDLYKEHKKSLEKMTNANQPYMVTEKNKQLMENNLRIEAKIALKKIIDDSLQYNIDLADGDMRFICEKIDSILRKANSDYMQLGSTNEEQIANAKMAMDIAETIIIEQLSRLKTSTLRKLSEYILKSKYYDDRRIQNIRKNLPTQD